MDGVPVGAEVTVLSSFLGPLRKKMTICVSFVGEVGAAS